MIKKVIIALIVILSLAMAGYGIWKSFESSSHPEIRISSNPWVGFTPFMYAQEKGWFEGTPFKFIWLVDLSDNSRLYEKQFTVGFTATQYELSHFDHPDRLVPAFVIDRSNGADVLLSNRTIEELKADEGEVAVYLERGSLSEDLFNAFVREYGMEKTGFKLVDSSQKGISAMSKSEKPVIIITYEPYASLLQNKGYKTIASTRTLRTFHVIDALFVENESFEKHRDDYSRLKKIYSRAYQQLQTNPLEYYTTIKGYLEGQSYEEFLAGTHQIEWLTEEPPAQILETLKQHDINTDRILR